MHSSFDNSELSSIKTQQALHIDHNFSIFRSEVDAVESQSNSMKKLRFLPQIVMFLKFSPSKRATMAAAVVMRSLIPSSPSLIVKTQFLSPSSELKLASPPPCSSLLLQAQPRPTWLPGLDPPSYLDDSLPGDFGFDPLGLGEDPENLRWYVQAELVHCRFAMAGIAGILFTDLLRVTGLSNIPVWYEAGAAKYEFADTGTLFIVQLLLMGFVETKRYMDFISPGSQANASFFGIEASLEGLAPGYPGGPLFNPLGIVKDINKANEWKLKEIKNGRLAMVAILGIFVQASVTHTGPIDNLITHLSNPWHATIIQTMITASSS